MSNSIYLIADTHFGHRLVPTFRPFPTVEAHDRVLVERWNATVRKQDTIWHLGDVWLGGQAGHTILGELNGIKRLVLGNHDHYPVALYLQYFSKIYGSVELRGCVLTHIPVEAGQKHRYRLNIHGHSHSKVVQLPDGQPDLWYRCVSAEQVAYTPKLFTEVIR